MRLRDVACRPATAAARACARPRSRRWTPGRWPRPRRASSRRRGRRRCRPRRPASGRPPAGSSPWRGGPRRPSWPTGSAGPRTRRCAAPAPPGSSRSRCRPVKPWLRSSSTPESPIFSFTRTFIGPAAPPRSRCTRSARDTSSGLDGREHADAQLVATQLAVRLGVDDAVGAQRLGDRGRVDGRRRSRSCRRRASAVRRVGHERRGDLGRLGPAVEVRRGLRGARGGTSPGRRWPASTRSGRRAGTGSPPPGCCSVWSLRELSSAVVMRQELGIHRSDAAISSIRAIAAGRSSASHSPPSEAKHLLRREVVDVGLRRRRPAGRRRPTWRRRGPARRPAPAGRTTSTIDAGGRLVVRPRVGRQRSGPPRRAGASPGSAFDDDRVAQERSAGGHRGELLRRTRRRSGAARARGSDPTAAASQKAVVPPLPRTTSYPSGREKSSAQPVAHATDEVLDRRLSVRRAHHDAPRSARRGAALRGGPWTGRSRSGRRREGRSLGMSRERLLVDTARGYKCPRSRRAIVLRSVGACTGCRRRRRS